MDDVDVARDDLIARGVAVSEVFHFAGGPFSSLENSRVGGRDPEGQFLPFVCLVRRSRWQRLAVAGDQNAAPGREWTSTGARRIDVATLAELLRETEEHHGHYEKTHAAHHWWDWYAPYLSARKTAALRRTRPLPPIATWARSSGFFPVDARSPSRP